MKLENRILNVLNNLEVGIMGTQHPATATVLKGYCGLIIIPGLAFNEANYRLGYGGSHYDNFLIKQPQALKAGIC